MGTEVGGKGEGVRVGGRGVEVGEGIKTVDVIVGKGAAVGVGAGEQEERRIKKRITARTRFITVIMAL